MGMDLARIATQVYGGMGYIEETGIAQRERDIRIAAIYEGTNGIQAIDLVGRKLPMRGGAVVDGFLHRMEVSTASWPTPARTWPACGPGWPTRSPRCAKPRSGFWATRVPTPTTPWRRPRPT